jgi:hypothetical protein
MDNNKERIVTAQWILERNLAWIAAAEVKVGVVVAMDTAMLGALGASYSSVDKAAHTAWALVVTSIALFALGAGLFSAAMAVLPRVTGPSTGQPRFIEMQKSPATNFRGYEVGCIGHFFRFFRGLLPSLRF